MTNPEEGKEGTNPPVEVQEEEGQDPNKNNEAEADAEADVDVVVKDKKDSAGDGDDDEFANAHPFFLFMARHPWPFLVLLPIAFFLLIGFGWSTSDKIEDEVTNLWIAQDGHYAADVNYMNSLGVDDLGASSFAALAIARDGGNMMTAERLALVRERMEETEKTQVRFV
jgi:predicted  nucleic acid-binding Zn-ribbon protein